MWKKDNPTGGPDSRDTSMLEGVKAQMPGEQAQPERREALSLTDIASTPIPANTRQNPTDFTTVSATAGTLTGTGGSGGGGGSYPPGPQGGSPDGSWKSLLAFHGKGSEYFILLLVNFLLSLVTLGIYSFWGRTKQRVYLWSKTQLWGEPLEYTGTGKELFISFLIVMPIVLVVMFLGGLLMQMSPVIGIIIFYPALIFAILFASYRALRFRLTRTRWRGIRGNLSGSAVSYASWGLLYILAMLFSLGLATPWATSRLVHLQLNNVWFGNRQMSFHGSSKELYKAFLLMLLGLVGLSILFGIVAFLFFASFMPGGYAPNPYASPLNLQMMTALIFMLLYIAYFFGILLISSFYHAHFIRWLYRHCAYGKVRTRSRITGRQVLGLRLTNALIVIFTLGFGYAWTHMRTLRLYFHSVDYTGDPEFNLLLQDTQSAPSRGEGLLDALDVDIAL